MLEAQVKAHREYLIAQSPGQKLFLVLKLRPQAQAAKARPSLSVAFVVDTSGSMREVVTEPTERTGETATMDGKRYNIVRGAKSKIDIVVEALQGLLKSDLLDQKDRLALVKFDDSAQIVVPFTAAVDRNRLMAAAAKLVDYSGGTHMGAGMEEALKLLQREEGSRRMILLTDGQTFDEPVVREVANKLSDQQIPITAVGVGDEWNENLLTEVTDRTQGKPYYVVPDTQNPQPPSLRATELPQAILSEMQQAAREVVTNVALSVRTVKDVKLDKVTRVSPAINEVDLSQQPHLLGNVGVGVDSVFVLEFSLPARPAVRMRIAQMGLTFLVPGANYRGEVLPIDVVVEFTQDESLTGRVDPEVMNFVQQRNVDVMIQDLDRQVRKDPGQARKTLELARNMTQKLGNNAMTLALDRALNELSTNKTISPGTSKTLKIGSKTQTLRSGTSGLPTEEEIRKLTGA